MVGLAHPALGAVPNVHKPLVYGDVATFPDGVKTQDEKHRRDTPCRRSNGNCGDVDDMETLKSEGYEERDHPRTCGYVSVAGREGASTITRTPTLAAHMAGCTLWPVSPARALGVFGLSNT